MNWRLLAVQEYSYSIVDRADAAGKGCHGFDPSCRRCSSGVLSILSHLGAVSAKRVIVHSGHHPARSVKIVSKARMWL